MTRQRLGRRALLGASLAALAAPMAVPRAATAAGEPAEVIRALNAALLASMKAPPETSFASREAALRPVIESAYALPAVLRAAVGLRFDGFPADQKAALLEAFTRFTVASYVSNFNAFGGESFEVTPPAAGVPGKVVVMSRIVPKSGEATAINYVMQSDGNGGWQIVDVLLAGTISRVAVQRSDFRSLVAAGNASALIKSLQAKVSALESGQKF